MKFRSAYDERKRKGFEIEGESLTQQHFAKEADIKTIIKKHDRTGIITHIARGVAQYGDYSEVNEYREALDVVRNANESFGALPAELRKMFDNDAGEFFEFATNPANEDKMVEMGLKEAPPSPQPTSRPAKEAARPQAAEQAEPPKSDE